MTGASVMALNLVFVATVLLGALFALAQFLFFMALMVVAVGIRGVVFLAAAAVGQVRHRHECQHPLVPQDQTPAAPTGLSQPPARRSTGREPSA